MGKYAQLVIGPAGSGKSTYCANLYEHCQAIRRSIHCVNLDPAAEIFHYPVSFDVRDLITLEDVMDELKLGPNGGLMYCMEYLDDNIEDWLSEELEGFGDADYLVFDCPGQIELYSHQPIFRSLCKYLQANGWHVCAVYVLDSHFMTDASKFIAGAMQALSAMVLLEVPHVNVLTKIDLCPFKENLDRFLMPDGRELASELTESMGGRFQRMNQAMGSLLDDFGLVSFLPLDITNDDAIADILYQIDTAIQYGEDEEVKSADYEDEGGAGEEREWGDDDEARD